MMKLEKRRGSIFIMTFVLSMFFLLGGLRTSIMDLLTLRRVQDRHLKAFNCSIVEKGESELVEYGEYLICPAEETTYDDSMEGFYY